MKVGSALSALVLLLCLVSVGHAARRTFSPSSSFFQSPERGFYGWIGSLVTASPDTAQWIRDSGHTLAFASVRLDDYRNTATLPAFFLQNLRDGFDVIRGGGIKVIIRCMYNSPIGEFNYLDAQDAPLDITLGHIRQLGPIFGQNADVIALIQAGFVGAWGEQHTSSNGNTEPGPMLEIRDAIKANFPGSRAIVWRSPSVVMEWNLGNTQKRIGLHNDCFMSSDTDLGTYSPDPSVRAVERAFAASISNWIPYGGETCNADVAAVQRRTCQDILREGKEFHLNYLNVGYYTGFHDQWKAEGCFSQIQRDLGPRIYVRHARAPRRVAIGTSAKFMVMLRNAGWSRLFNYRQFNMVLVQGSTQIFVRLNGRDPNRIPPLDGRGRWYKGSWSPPAGLSGTFSLHLLSLDGYTSLHGDPRYNLRFANDEPWDDNTGKLNLGMTITIR